MACLSDNAYSHDINLLGDDQATCQKLCPGTVLCLVCLNSVQGGLVKGNPVTCNHTCDSCQWLGYPELDVEYMLYVSSSIPEQLCWMPVEAPIL
jgi:hypothetical protein